MNPLEEVINNLIKEVEAYLLDDKINTSTPEAALNYSSKLSSYYSSSMGKIEKLNTLEAEHFINERPNHKSDISVKKTWATKHEGIRQEFWENRIKRLGKLIEAVDKLYYYSRKEEKYTKELK